MEQFLLGDDADKEDPQPIASSRHPRISRKLSGKDSNKTFCVQRLYMHMRCRNLMSAACVLRHVFGRYFVHCIPCDMMNVLGTGVKSSPKSVGIPSHASALLMKRPIIHSSRAKSSSPYPAKEGMINSPLLQTAGHTRNNSAERALKQFLKVSYAYDGCIALCV